MDIKNVTCIETNKKKFSIRKIHDKKMLKKYKIASKIDNLRIIENAIDNITAEIGISQDYYGKILIGTLEAVNNAIIHGNKSVENRFVNVDLKIADADLEVTVPIRVTGLSLQKYQILRDLKILKHLMGEEFF